MTKWNDEFIKSSLAPYIKKLGRMPSSNELRAANENGLHYAIAQRRGYLWWANTMGVEQSGEKTHRGQKWERHEKEFFEALGFRVQTYRYNHPFDLLVGKHRVDVKSGEFYEHSKVGGYYFAGLKYGADCDFFDLVCNAGEKILHRFIVPAEFADVQTIMISAKTIAGTGKYSPFENALTWLD